MKKTLCLNIYPRKKEALRARDLLLANGIKASTQVKDFGKRRPEAVSTQGTMLWVELKEGDKAEEILHRARKAELSKGPMRLPPEEGTLEFLDMLIHDCRQYLMIATGELKDIDEEGELELDDPTNDIDKIAIRLKRLKDRCMRVAGRRPLDWQR